MYEVGVSRSFRAQHVMPGMPGPEGELHTHDYRLEVVVERADLDERGMVCDLDVLQDRVEGIVARVEGGRLDEVQGLQHPEGVTVEVLARWSRDAIRSALGSEAGDAVSVRVWESPVAFGGYRASSSR
jgi:6-pyruvoyltetrahydropterin/6-carboxytetrahydropterin synthase